MSAARAEPAKGSAAPAPRAQPDREAPVRTAPAGDAGSFLDRVIERAAAEPRPAGSARPAWLSEFLAERSPARAAALWLGPAAVRALGSRAAISRRIGSDIARLDAAISDQLNAVLHHEKFQQLEASWRGLEYLVERAGEAEQVKVKVLNVAWRELARDAQLAVEFDQSQLFKKVYENEFGMSGGEPFGVLLGDYEIRHTMGPDHATDDLAVLGMIAQVAAASFAPFVAAASPALFGMESFAMLERPMNLGRIFGELEYARWRDLRESEDARFVALTLPRVLMRLPYRGDDASGKGFLFDEDVDGRDRGKYLWGNAAYAFGAVLVRAFADCRWLAEIRGVKRDVEDGGVVTGLPVHSFGTEKIGAAAKSSTDLVIDDQLEKQLSGLGFMPLCQLKDADRCAFYSTGSIQVPKAYREEVPALNARISAMLQYILCVSRFAHYVKIRVRDKIGTVVEARELEDDLNQWIHEYVAPDSDAAPSFKARFPLREARVQVTARRDKEGAYQCVMHLLPHYQLDAVTATVTLRTEQRRGQSA